MEKSEKLKNLTDRRAYKLLTTIDQDPYSEECYRVHYTVIGVLESIRKNSCTGFSTGCIETGSTIEKQNGNEKNKKHKTTSAQTISH